jgi:hypothetical protein
MCDLRRDRGPGDFGEPGIGTSGQSAQHKKQETLRGASGQNQQTPPRASIKAKNIIPEDTNHLLIFISSAPVWYHL